MISRTSEGEYYVKCFRRLTTSLNKFVYPERDDFTDVRSQDIVHILQIPKIVRDIHYFSDDLSNFQPLR